MDDDDSDDEVPASGGSCGKPSVEPWKLDVKSMVKDFAREERARSGVGAKAPAAPRPPKAPPTSAPVRRNNDPEGERQPLQPRDSNSNPDPENPLYSRKPREVDYVPASLDEFKQKGYDKKEVVQLGKLGPDLDDPELLMKRAVQEQQKQFSKELQKINRQRMSVAAQKGTKPETKPEAKPTARSKAEEFARNVPKPKAPQPVKPLRVEKKPREADAAKEAEKETEKDQADWDEIRRREKQHHEDVLRVKDIKDFLGQLPH